MGFSLSDQFLDVCALLVTMEFLDLGDSLDSLSQETVQSMGWNISYHIRMGSPGIPIIPAFINIGWNAMDMQSLGYMWGHWDWEGGRWGPQGGGRGELMEGGGS